MPQKNTFIHFEEALSPVGATLSAPGALQKHVGLLSKVAEASKEAAIASAAAARRAEPKVVHRFDADSEWSPATALSRKPSDLAPSSGASQTTSSEGDYASAPPSFTIRSSSGSLAGDWTPNIPEALSELPPRLTVPAKNTFVHFDPENSPVMGALKTAPAVLGQDDVIIVDHTEEAGDTEEPRELCEEPCGATLSPSSCGSWGSADSPLAPGAGSSPSSPGGSSSTTFALWRGDGLDRVEVLPKDDVSGQDAVRLSSVLACKSQALASVGAQAHGAGRCVPCLMQVRWNTRRCGAPCRFGILCNRCHEPHTMDELERAQAQMRKQRRRGSRREARSLEVDQQAA